ncbi:MAG: hypothetical protein ABJG68_12880 [Crocinitomicaceae bacterium]
MKKYLILGSIVAGFAALTACNKNNGCPNSSEKATVRVFEDNDSCDVLFQLEDGTKLEPTNLSEFQVLDYEEGMWVWVKYKPASGASKCGLGDIVKLKCVSEREF